MCSPSCLQTACRLLHFLRSIILCQSETLSWAGHMSHVCVSSLGYLQLFICMLHACTRSHFVYRTSLQTSVLKSIVNLYSGLHPRDAVADGHRSRTVIALLRLFILSICSPVSFLAHMQQYSHQSLLLLLWKNWKLAANRVPAPALSMQTMRVDATVLSPTSPHILPECAHV